MHRLPCCALCEICHENIAGSMETHLHECSVKNTRSQEKIKLTAIGEIEKIIFIPDRKAKDYFMALNAILWIDRSHVAQVQKILDCYLRYSGINKWL